MNRAHLLLCVSLAAFLSGCAGSAPYSRTVGLLQPGKRIELRVGGAQVDAYAPRSNEPTQSYTVEATASAAPPPPVIQSDARGIVVTAPESLADILVRVPPGVDLVVRSARGDINVTNVGGNADLVTENGSVRALLDGYAQATVGNGDISVTMGALAWPGTLHFRDRNGDVTLFVAANAQFHVHLSTQDGTIFSDFGLRGDSHGTAEWIDGTVGSPSNQALDIEVTRGSIRLLRLLPQA
ncbi:MAG TPA: DUF4097 family beta strand repeat-containing protein [Candidatus Dormibacteraeota bacterium]|nr:DUF4097 family beta strand repeat-containing protein [Candidatus Dormibacteraeota bacterium]